MLRDDGLLATRGDGIYGKDITTAFNKGVVDVGKGITGVGELVMVTKYFENNLKSLGYSHPRNICVGVVNSDELNKDFMQALKDGVIRFVPYSTLNRWEGNFTELLDQHDDMRKQTTKSCEYPTDGVVVEITHEGTKNCSRINNTSQPLADCHQTKINNQRNVSEINHLADKENWKSYTSLEKSSRLNYPVRWLVESRHTMQVM